MAFSSSTFDPNAFTIAVAPTHVFTSSPTYWEPLKCRVEIYNNIGTELLLVYDSFLPETNAIVLLNCEVSLGLTNSSFTLRFEDGAGAINQNTIGLGNKVLVYAGRQSDDLTLLFTGYSETRISNYIG